ncbi:MAG TPA: hypothetical protein VGM25_01340 [Caulobacteraceae bacterium]|jgi:hypothetical protein
MTIHALSRAFVLGAAASPVCQRPIPAAAEPGPDTLLSEAFAAPFARLSLEP